MRWIPVLFALPLFLSPAAAEESTLSHGRRLVEANCAMCHALEDTGSSPFSSAPPFREVARNYSNEELVDGFLEGLAVHHPAMPDWDMTEDQAEAIAIYIMGLRTSEADRSSSVEAAGREIIASNCSRCHAVEASGASPLAQAPPFRELVKRYEASALEEALAEGIVTGHEDMPEFEFGPDEISAITAYLDSLRLTQ